MPDWGEFQAIAANDSPRVVYVRALSYSMIMVALASVQFRGQWGIDGVPVTDSEWDEIEAVVGGAFWDMVQNDLIGTLYWTVAPTLPVYVLPLDGDTYGRADFPALWDVLPAAWKTETEFTLPDWRDRFPAIAGASYAPGDTGGAASVTLTENQMPSHTHTSQPHVHDYSGAVVLPDIIGELPGVGAQVSPLVTGSATVTINAAGGDAAHENRPPFVAINVGVIAW